MIIFSRLLVALVLASKIIAETQEPRPGKNETQELNDWISRHRDVSGSPYQLESHIALARDGVKLTLFRLARPGSQPLLLQHGILDSAWMWVINPSVRRSIALHLYDQGFDVWMGNNRGNYFSSSWNRSEPVATSYAFWNFSFAEMGIFDVPASINYILKHTGKAHLQYIAHSQGTTQFFIAAQTPGVSEFLQQSVSKFIALSPVSFLGNTTNEFLKILARTGVVVKARSIFPYSFMDSSTLLDADHFFCDVTAGRLCKFSLDVFDGVSSLVSPAAIDKYSDHFPLGTSVKDMQHFAQLITSNEFRKFDYGPERNKEVYGSREPPPYQLSRCNINMALFFGENDAFVRPGDRERLVAALPPNVISWSKIYGNFSHVTWHTGVESATAEFYGDLVQQLTSVREGQLSHDPQLLIV